jgi:hypothetical protein
MWAVGGHQGYVRLSRWKKKIVCLLNSKLGEWEAAENGKVVERDLGRLCEEKK